MSSSSNSPTARRARRRLLLALAAWPLAPAWPVDDPTRGLRRWGQGEYRRLGFVIYSATLWGGDDPMRPPLALRLDYRRSIAGRVIAEASLAEMRRLGASEAQLRRWEPQLLRLFPDVLPGDAIVGVYRPDGARFIHNGRLLGEVADADFARLFFAIWLDPRSSAPDLRAALLGRPEG